MRVRLSANERALSETEFAAEQFTAGSGAITSDKSRATTSMKLATTLALLTKVYQEIAKPEIAFSLMMEK